MRYIFIFSALLVGMALNASAAEPVMIIAAQSADFFCPPCNAFHDDLPQIEKKYPDEWWAVGKAGEVATIYQPSVGVRRAYRLHVDAKAYPNFIVYRRFGKRWRSVSTWSGYTDVDDFMKRLEAARTSEPLDARIDE